jgi:hypothetical protein
MYGHPGLPCEMGAHFKDSELEKIDFIELCLAFLQ